MVGDDGLYKQLDTLGVMYKSSWGFGFQVFKYFNSFLYSVLYPPPQSPIELQMGSRWTASGVKVKNTSKQQFVLNSSGVQVDSTWNSRGLLMDFTPVS